MIRYRLGKLNPKLTNDSERITLFLQTAATSPYRPPAELHSSRQLVMAAAWLSSTPMLAFRAKMATSGIRPTATV